MMKEEQSARLKAMPEFKFKMILILLNKNTIYQIS